MLDHLNQRMREFVERQSMLFLATSDGSGSCDCSLRAGPPGFVRVLDEHRLVYPEYRGNGVLASLANLDENPSVALLFLDFVHDVIGLHVNGRAEVLDPGQVPDEVEDRAASCGGRRAEHWVQVDVEEAYVHCRKHIPRLAPREWDVSWGTDDVRRKGGDFFGVAAHGS